MSADANDAYLATCKPAARDRLLAIRAVIEAAAP